MNSLKSNVILNFINTVTGIIFPVITFPYASRILMPEGIGIINFQTSIINYIVILTSLGIPMYAVREVAKYRDDTYTRNRITVEILLLSVILCVCGYIVVGLLASYIPQIHDNVQLFYVLSLTILFTGIGVQWFYQGIEDFKFITIRAVIVRILAAVCLFLFVKNSDDIIIYGAVTVGTSAGNYIINFVHLHNYISFKELKWSELNVIRHMGPALHIFVLNLIISIYVNLNTVMLGFMQDDTSVGLYTAGSKLSHVILTAVTSIGAVMIPRCSNLIKTGNIAEFSRISSKAIRFVLILSLPCMVGIMLLAKPIIWILCGEEFMLSVPVLYWTAPIIVFISITNFIGLQVLYPQNKENIVIWSTVGGAVVNLLLNLVLIPIYSEKGAAISTFAAELMVLIVQIVYGYKYIPIKLFDKRYLIYVWATVIMIIPILFVLYFVKGYILQIVVSTILGGIVYCGYLFLKKEEVFIDIYKSVLRK